MTPEAALALGRFALDASAMLLWGAFGYLALLVPADLSRRVAGKLATMRIVAAALAVASAAALLPIQAAMIGDGWLDAAATSTALLDTGIGRAWLVQFAAGCLVAAAGFAPGRWRAAATAAAAGLLLSTRALSGHAAAQEGALGIAHQLNHVVHLLAGGAWLGALVPLLAVLRALDDPQSRTDAAVALRRFSAAGHGAVALVVASGVLSTLLILGRWPTDWASPYQALLAVKIALVAVMTLLAIANRYVVVPLLHQRRTKSLATLRAATVAEVGLGVAAIALVAVFGTLEPA